MIDNYEDEYLFGNEVAKIATPAKPIDSIERLLGREKYLDQIKKHSSKMVGMYLYMVIAASGKVHLAQQQPTYIKVLMENR
ncbi:hypothetical protein [Chromobacterium vaccinii]|uniref:hypothetical protein n=1 Tax=Chromobacterium vaccinii TaxID=1108595 RepID=UPI0011C02183|nr:hypothetical protein [Chromobacterium vaccinii]